MVNGYVFLDLTKSNVYAEALKVLGTDKPVVIKDGSGSPYFVDSLTLDGTNVVITKGGKTITIANDNTITNVGTIENSLMENIKDLAGNLRFFEVEGTETETISGVTTNYCKASLSGTHLMFVVAVSIANTTDLTFPSRLRYNFKLPKWLVDKIAILFGTDRVDNKSFNAYATDETTQSFNFLMQKVDDENIRIYQYNNITLTADRNLRIQFDLLIDAE